MPLNVGILRLYLQHSQEGNYYWCARTHVHGDLSTAGW